ncbi:MAG: DegT/DnrJ/EryC1/StrS family aminotransferase [Deltaproteobacteria bacterium]|nr:DegT/DnrJ/EryC1/StrS family aminotransferase [Deltaproteobacteria bacterium]
MKVPLLDLKEQYKRIKDEIIKAVMEVFDSQQFILGPKVEELEEGIAAYCRSRYAVGVSSGTDALLISLMMEDVSHGDVVITTPYTFFSTAGAIVRVGARPLFVDIDENSYNMDPVKLDATILSLDEKQKSEIKAIIPVHLYGQCADMEQILDIAEKNNLIVIEDAAQAIGAEYQFRDGAVKRAGSMGTYGCFSFFPSKNMGAFGDGGVVTTDDPEIYELLKKMRVHGSGSEYYHNIVGGNFRLDAIQAAVLLVKLKYLDDWTKKRRENAALYRRLFQEKGVKGVSLPKELERRHIYNQFVIRISNRRDELKDYLIKGGIGCAIYYPVPLHMQACFIYLGYGPDDFPVSLEAAENTLALPVYPELSHEQIEYVVDMIDKFMK